MHNSRSRFGVPKTALVAAAAGCLALGFAAPQQAAAVEATDAPSNCPAPGQETVTAAEQPAQASPSEAAPVLEDAQTESLRVATYDTDLSRAAPNELFEDLSTPGTKDAKQVANVIQEVRPDILVLTGIDVDSGDELVDAFNTNYLAVGGDDHGGITYPYSYTALSNAGVESGADLDRDGTIGGPNDALGYGDFPGQSSMIVYSKYPIDTDNVRDFTSLPWSKMPDNRIPESLTELERDTLPLSSVSHWDVPIEVEGETIHLLATSATDASESQHGTARNHDQIRFWQDYVEPETDYIIDHRGDRGPLEEGAPFVIAGSLKADPAGDGPADPTAITSLLESEAITDPQQDRTLTSSALRGGVVPNNQGALHDTAPHPTDRNETYRADYVLVSSDMTVNDSGILETGTARGDAYWGFFGMQPEDNTNHIVWADTALHN